MTKEIEMSTKYQPNKVEQGKYEKWLELDLFKPNENDEAEPYSVVIPPPNVTGKLHLGHAWDTTLQDIIIRQKRMQGFDTLWLPGMDHAGIATQARVEEKLNEAGTNRYELGRENFLKEAWKWTDEYSKDIREQWATMGLSLDYSRERFTLDEGLSQAVTEVFVELYNRGLIYRGEYIINWDPKAQTALSDIEVEHKDTEGAFYHMKYPLADGSGDSLEIATTRPETMLGDTAVAVHPEDERYQKYIGKAILLPLMEREIPVIADSYVDREFGTGVVKITPAHDPNDFDIGNRHNLPRLNVMNADGTMNENAGQYADMDRFEARKQIIQDLKTAGLLVKVEEMVHSVGHSERTGVVVEPRLSTQWFVRMEELAQQALDNQKTDKKVHFYPERFEKTFVNWMENVHDWVISRQLWWGHRIPAWYHNETGEVYVGKQAPEDEKNWTQDEDVLDTWFSSALWPFSTMGWPDTQSRDFQRYYPTNTLVTGYDIIFFWVSRMIFQGLEFTDEIPFKNVLLHGLIRDEQGLKMSKSLDNGIDPMDVIDKYGADALRWFLTTGSSPGQDVRFSYERMDSSWNFINKIWNASRYVIMNLNEFTLADMNLEGEKTLADRWILTRLNETIAHVTEQFEKFEFGEAGRALYNFMWDEYCDWYIEMSKEILNEGTEEQKTVTKSILTYVLDQTLRLLHPIMPFVTEEIWQHLPHDGVSIMVAEYPTVREAFTDDEARKNMNMLIELIKAVRTIRQEVNRPLSKPVDVMIQAHSEFAKENLLRNQSFIERFCNTGDLTISTKVSVPNEVMSAVIKGADVYLPLEGLVDIQEEIARLEKELEKWTSEIKRAQNKLSNERFVENAPEDVVQAERDKEKEYKSRYQSVEEQIKKLKNLK